MLSPFYRESNKKSGASTIPPSGQHKHNYAPKWKYVKKIIRVIKVCATHLEFPNRRIEESFSHNNQRRRTVFTNAYFIIMKIDNCRRSRDQ